MEATAGGFESDSGYERRMHSTPAAIENELYLRPLAPREAVGVMASTYMEVLAASKRGDDLLAVADMLLAVNPRDVVAMMQKGNAYYLQLEARYRQGYPTLADIPPHLHEDYRRLSRENLAWFEKAENLGWAPWTNEQERDYRQSIEREKARRSGE